METLLDDYKRKLRTTETLINENKNIDIKKDERLRIMAATYRSFIVDIERAIKRQKEYNNE